MSTRQTDRDRFKACVQRLRRERRMFGDSMRRQNDQLLEYVDELSLLRRLSDGFSAGLDRDLVYRTTVNLLSREVRCDGVFMLRRVKASGAMTPVTSAGQLHGMEVSASCLGPQQLVAIRVGPRRVRLNRRPDPEAPIMLKEMPEGRNGELVVSGEAEFQSMLALPVNIRHCLDHLILLIDRDASFFDEGHVRSLSILARQVALALSNARAYTEARRLNGELERILEKQAQELHDAEQDLLASARFATVGEMAAEIGHEINNYLSVLSGRTELILNRLRENDLDRAARNAEMILEHVRRAQRLASGLIDFSHQEPTRSLCSVKELVESTVGFVSPQNRFDAVEFDIDIPSSLPDVECDAGQIQQLLLNLLTNATDSISLGSINGGTIRARAKLLEDGKHLSLEVEDDGPGIPDENLSLVFQPRFTTKRHGHGLGLSVCQRIAAWHGGQLRGRNGPGGGAIFEVVLPLRQKARVVDDRETLSPVHQGGPPVQSETPGLVSHLTERNVIPQPEAVPS